MIRTLFRTAPVLATLLVSLLGTTTAQAVDPDSVDIDLRRSTLDTNSLEVYIRVNGQPFGDVLSGLTFTIRWETTSTATLGARVNTCPSGIPISATAQETNPLLDGVPTGYNYRSYNAFGTSLLTDEGCPIPQDEWYLVMTVAINNNTGCTEFNIVNDDWTDSPGNARDYFVSLGGIDLTGSIDSTSAFIGACAVDCQGNVGGIALPGTPCDDDSTVTVNDTWTAECICAGELTTLINTASTTTEPAVWPNPTTGMVYVRAGQAGTVSHVRVSDVLGRVLTTQLTRTNNASPWLLDLSSEPTGVYLVELETGGLRSVERIVKR